MSWLRDDEQETVELLRRHGYDHDDFLEALSDVPETDPARLVAMNAWLGERGNKDLEVCAVRENEVGNLDWMFIPRGHGGIVA